MFLPNLSCIFCGKWLKKSAFGTLSAFSWVLFFSSIPIQKDTMFYFKNQAVRKFRWSVLNSEGENLRIPPSKKNGRMSLKMDHFQRTFHLPTMNFQAICWFFRCINRRSLSVLPQVLACSNSFFADAACAESQQLDRPNNWSIYTSEWHISPRNRD